MAASCILSREGTDTEPRRFRKALMPPRRQSSRVRSLIVWKSICLVCLGSGLSAKVRPFQFPPSFTQLLSEQDIQESYHPQIQEQPLNFSQQKVKGANLGRQRQIYRVFIEEYREPYIENENCRRNKHGPKSSSLHVSPTLILRPFQSVFSILRFCTLVSRICLS